MPHSKVQEALELDPGGQRVSWTDRDLCTVIPPSCWSVHLTASRTEFSVKIKHDSEDVSCVSCPFLSWTFILLKQSHPSFSCFYISVGNTETQMIYCQHAVISQISIQPSVLFLFLLHRSLFYLHSKMHMRHFPRQQDMMAFHCDISLSASGGREKPRGSLRPWPWSCCCCG